MKAAKAIWDFAREKGATAAQVALAWMLSKGTDIVPIPGTKQRKYLEENLAAAALELNPADIDYLDSVLPPGKTAGPRYTSEMMSMINR